MQVSQFGVANREPATPISPSAEMDRLHCVARSYIEQGWGFNTSLLNMGFRSLRRYLTPGTILEVGCADGEMTKFLLTCGQDLTVLDAVAEFVEIVCNLDKRIHGVVSLIEEWETSERFDNIVFAHVLEHVADPLGILRTLGRFLAPGGRLIIIVPNANSLHRLVGVKMGLISHMCELNDSDRRVGHRRVYTPSTLCADITAAGLSLVKWEGIFLKPLANGQLTADNWSPELVEAYYQLGFDYPELCGGSLPFAKLPTELPRSDSPN